MAVMMAGEAHPYTGHSVKGKKVSHIIKNLEVCLCTSQDRPQSRVQWSGPLQGSVGTCPEHAHKHVCICTHTHKPGCRK